MAGVVVVREMCLAGTAPVAHHYHAVEIGAKSVGESAKAEVVFASLP